jgi:predicted metal-dependent hydrolase
LSADERAHVLQDWYRERLKALIPPLLEKRQPRTDVCVREWNVRRMRTKWGSCTPGASRIWLNLELAKKPFACIEFVLVHELVHLLERHHNARFTMHMDRLMPDWRARRGELNAAPLAHEDWTY